ncbi:MAG: hypothetical protein KZQ99_13860 [Candidatus Thiodiazotropha sp. (ex Dulcina madagascariensis)]|nr:hypothetical protein [Candidatus Thiodiazotropha sp. (ex Dulcina madagascariensis)]
MASGSKKVIFAALIGNTLISVTKFAAAFVTGSSAMLSEGAAWLFAFREFSRAKGKWGYLEAVQRAKDPSIFVVLFEDTAAMLGLIVAFAGIALTQLTGYLLFDGIASIMIGLILVGTAAWLAYETKSLLIGESANPAVVQGIRELAGAKASVDCVNEVLTMHMGPDFVLANVSVDFRDSITADEVERTIGEMDGAIKERFPQVKRIFIEAEKRVLSSG